MSECIEICSANKSRVITFKARPELVELMDALAKELGISRSELIKAGIFMLYQVKRGEPVAESSPVQIIQR